MSGLRDMYVSIRFRDEATAQVRQVDRSMDRAERRFRNLGDAADESTSGFRDLVQETNRLDEELRNARNEMQQMRDQIERTAHEMEDLRGEVNRLTDGLDDAGEAGVHSFATLNSLATRFVGSTSLIITALSTMVAAGAPLIALGGGLTSSFATAGIGAVAFGAVATSALTAVFDASEEVLKLEEKIAAADTVEKRLKAQQELAALYADMSKEQRGALKSLQGFKKFWKGFVAEFENPIFDAFDQGLQATQKTMNNFKPAISGVASVVSRVMSSVNRSLDGKEAKQFFTWIGDTAPKTIGNFAKIAGNTFSGVFNVLQAFSPIAGDIEGGLVGMTDKFKTWSAGLQTSTGFQNFIAYAKENGPTLLGIIGNTATGFKKLVTDLAPFGTTVLSGIQTFTSMIVDNWDGIKDVVISVAAGFAGFKVASGLATGFGAASKAITKFRDTSKTAGGTLKALSLVIKANPIGIIVTAIGLAITAGVYLYRNWDTVKAKATEVWGTVTEKWNTMKDNITGAVPQIKDKLSNTWNMIKTDAINAWNGLKSGVMTVVTGFQTGLAIRWNVIKTTAINTWNGLKSGVMTVVNGFQTGLTNAWNNVKGATASLWTTVKEKFAGIKTSISNMVTPVLGWFSNLESKWDDFKAAISNFKVPGWMSKIGGAISGAASKLGSMIDGSHATGLERVPYDGYRAELHRGEAVLTAGQSNALRSAGILSSNSDGTPSLNMETKAPTLTGMRTHADDASRTAHTQIFNTTNETYENRTELNANPLQNVLEKGFRQLQSFVGLPKQRDVAPLGVQRSEMNNHYDYSSGDNRTDNTQTFNTTNETYENRTEWNTNPLQNVLEKGFQRLQSFVGLSKQQDVAPLGMQRPEMNNHYDYSNETSNHEENPISNVENRSENHNLYNNTSSTSKSNSISITIPITIQGNADNETVAKLKSTMETTVRDVIARMLAGEIEATEG